MVKKGGNAKVVSNNIEAEGAQVNIAKLVK